MHFLSYLENTTVVTSTFAERPEYQGTGTFAHDIEYRFSFLSVNWYLKWNLKCRRIAHSNKNKNSQ